LQFTKAHTDLQFARGVENSVLTRFCYKIMQAAGTLNYENVNIRKIDQEEAQQRKYKRLRLGGGK